MADETKPEQTSDNAAPPPNEGEQKAGGDQSPPPDYRAQLDDMTRKIAALEAEREAARKEAEAAKAAAERDAMSAEEKAAAALAEQQDALKSEREQLRADRLRMELDRRGIAERGRKFVPDVDPSTDEGRQALDSFAAEYPEFVKRTDDVRPPVVDPDEATAKRHGTSVAALKATIDNFRAIGKSDDWISRTLGTR